MLSLTPISVILPNDCNTQDNSWDELKIRLGLKLPYPKIINTVPVIVNNTHQNYFNNTPFYTLDVIPNIKYDYSDLNDDKSVLKTITKYYFYKIIDKFLKSEMIDLLGYLHISSDDSVKFIKNIKEKSDKLPNDSEIKTKINFLENEFLKKSMVRNIIKKYVHKNNIMLYKIQENETDFKKYLHKKLKEHIEEKIKS
jgi:hypothetical protein